MKHHLASLLPLLLAAAACLTPVSRLAAEELDFSFKPDEAKEWTLDRRVADKPSLVFSKDPAPGGLVFTNEGFDLLTRTWEGGKGALEISADLTLTQGRAEQFNRARGLVITLSSAPVEQMQPSDLALILAVTQTGPSVGLKSGGARIGAPVPKREGLYQFPGQNLGARLDISMSGAGGQDYSVRWPTKMIAGTKIRFWAARHVDGRVQFRIYNADGVAAPWWEGETQLPEQFRAVPLNVLTVHTGREPQDVVDFSKFFLAVGQGSGPCDGVLTRLRLRELKDKPRLDEPFPAALQPPPDGWKPGSRLLQSEAIRELRQKFDSPAFADYKKVLLRSASPEKLANLKPGQPDQNEALVALTYAYILTGDKATYWDRLIREIDALSGDSDIYPVKDGASPGRMRQNLFIREFWVHNMAALAMAQDLLGAELDATRRDRIRFLLERAMRDYHALLDDGDWWYGGNPSNTIGVGNGCMGIVAVVMMEQSPELAKKTLERALANIEKYFLGVDPDGGCIEGAMYWNYGLGYPMWLGWCLRQATGDDRGLLTSPQVKNASRYLAVNVGGDGKMVPFNDNQPWIVGWPVVAGAGAAANDPLARWMADHMARVYAAGDPEREQARSTYTVPAFLYRDTTPAPEKFPGLPNVATLKSVDEAVLRSNGAEWIPAMVTAVKGKGELSTHHANQDQGSFVFYADGEMVLLDPGYFEGQAQKHSLPLIGDAATMILNHLAACPVSDPWEAGPLRSLTVDATPAYNTGKNAARPLAERARRVFVQHGDRALVVLDDTLPRNAQDRITAQYQAGVAATVSGGTARLKGTKADIQLQTFGPTLALEAVPREFSKNWIYKRSGVSWTTLQAAYTADPTRPLVTVLLRGGGEAKVDYAEARITVEGPGGVRVEFERTPEGWKAAQPKR